MSQAGKWGFSTFADELQVKYLYSVEYRNRQRVPHIKKKEDERKKDRMLPLGCSPPLRPGR